MLVEDTDESGESGGGEGVEEGGDERAAAAAAAADRSGVISEDELNAADAEEAAVEAAAGAGGEDNDEGGEDESSGATSAGPPSKTAASNTGFFSGLLGAVGGKKRAINKQPQTHAFAALDQPRQLQEQLAAAAAPAPESESESEGTTKGGDKGKLRPKKKLVTSIVLVGNGRSNLRKRLGAQVDAFDLVGRFNFLTLKKYEENVGTRTDLWFINELRQPGPKGHRGSRLATGNMDLSIKPKKYIVPIVYPNGKGCSPKSHKGCGPSRGAMSVRKKTAKIVQSAYGGKYKLTGRLEIMPLAIQRAISTKYHYYGTWPSTGILAIVYCLENYPGAVVSIMGYDFAHKALGHYWEKVKKKTTSHSMSAEGRFVARLVMEGKVKHLA